MTWDAVVIGGGYYGCQVALRLARGGNVRRVLLVEAELRILGRASRWNQARVHGGYHYPRAQITARASRRSYRRFLSDHRDAVAHGMRAVYAIARSSGVSPSQFERHCGSIGAPLHAAPAQIEQLFDPEFIEAVYSVEEVGFDADIIADQLGAALGKAGVTTSLGKRARLVESDGKLAHVAVDDECVAARYVFNCSYSNLDCCGVPLRAQLKRERSEMALIEPPRELEGWGITVMDGPFFSVIPFPVLGLHSLSHVRFTPRFASSDDEAFHTLPSGVGPSINGDAMVRDAARFLPCMREARLRGSIHEVKTVLVANESDDGRPVLIERCQEAPNVISVLGGKLDNIYDVLDAMDEIIAPEMSCGRGAMA